METQDKSALPRAMDYGDSPRQFLLFWRAYWLATDATSSSRPA
jgi:hypothetical protein